MTEMNMVKAINSALKEEMERDKTVMVLGEDVGADGGVFRVTDGLIDQFGEDRVADTPLAESGIIGSSIGLSISGLKPVAEIQFSGFIYPGFDQLISHASRMRNRTRGKINCQMVVRAPYSGGIHAPEHHSESMEALYAHTPGLKVVIPSNPYDAKGLLLSAIRDPDPVLFLEPKKIYRAVKNDVPEGEDYTVPIGKAKVVKEGKDISIFSWGSMLHVAKHAAKKAEEKGYGCEVIDLRTISPLDEKTIVDSVKKTGRAIVVQEAPKSFGPASEIITLINEQDLLYLEAPAARVTGWDTIFPLYKMENYYLPNTKRVLDAIEKTMNF